MAAGIIDLVSDLVQLSTSEDEQDSEDDITSSASPKSTPQSKRGKMDSSSSTSAATDTSTRTGPSLLSVLQQAKPSDSYTCTYIATVCGIQKLTSYCHEHNLIL